jgi:hypothetical protein
MRLSGLVVAAVMLFSSAVFAQHSSTTPSSPPPSAAPSTPPPAPAPGPGPSISLSTSSASSVPSASHSSAPSSPSLVSIPESHAAPMPGSSDSHASGNEGKIVASPRIGEAPPTKETKEKDSKTSEADLRRRICPDGPCQEPEREASRVRLAAAYLQRSRLREVSGGRVSKEKRSVCKHNCGCDKHACQHDGLPRVPGKGNLERRCLRRICSSMSAERILEWRILCCLLGRVCEHRFASSRPGR